LKFPKCELLPSQTYVFRYTLTSSDGSITSSTDITLNTQQQKFRADVIDGDRDHIENTDLEVEAGVIPEGGCPFLGEASLTYEWSCSIA